MLQKAKDLQNNAVNKLIELTDTQDIITFKSPTGSGKTYMMAKMINNILDKNKDVIFLISSLSKGGLAKQNYEQFMKYKSNGAFDKINPYLISSEIAGEERLHIPSEHNVYVLPRDLYKTNSRLMQGAMENFLYTMKLSKYFNGFEKKIYLIKDECHQATKNLDSLSKFFDKVYNFSATPKLSKGRYPDVEIKNEEAVDAKLIKSVELIDDENIRVCEAINKFEEVKSDYRNLLGVNPCLIIQISNKEKANEELQEIYAELNKAEHIDLKWMLIVDKDKECETNDIFKAKKLPVSKWKDYAKEDVSTIDIIIFKMVITEGWDIPRACMLYQMRNSQSTQLDEQVMGRVRRNPRLLDFETLSDEAQKLAMTSWVWGIAPKNKEKSFGVKLCQDNDIITNNFKIKTTKLKELSEKQEFDIRKLLNEQLEVSAPTSIFELYKNYVKSDNIVQDICNKYSQSYSNWLKFVENIEVISVESKKYICDYENSMEIAKNEDGNDLEVSFANSSYYSDRGNYLNINDWVWKRNDGKEKFSFDSEAEQKWAEILKQLVEKENQSNKKVGKKISIGNKNLNINQQTIWNEETNNIFEEKQVYLWGKNYVANSEIKFEYYLEGLHLSYPDFVMKDSYNRIHIFEVKSVNISANKVSGFDEKKYKIKLEELKKAYKQASKLTNQIFYLPILRDKEWRIFQYINGNEKSITKQEFFSFCMEESK